MLNLYREVDGKIVIEHAGERLVLTVCEIGGKSVQLGFEGPHSFVINRVEVQTKIDSGVGYPQKLKPLRGNQS